MMPANDKPVLIVVAGPNGSGKTSLTSSIMDHAWADGCEHINPDNIARDKFGDWNSAEASLSAAKYAEAVRVQCIKERRGLAFETVMSMRDKVDFIRYAKDCGYFVRLFFIATDSPSINAARVAQRVMEGGHTVEIPKIISRYSKAIANCIPAIAFSDRAYIYDNSVDGAEPKLLFRASEGRIAKVYDDSHAWAQSVALALSCEKVDAVAPRA